MSLPALVRAPVVRALLAQGLAAACVLPIVPLLRGTLPPWALLLLLGAAAVAASALLRLPWWWWPVQLVAPLGVVALASTGTPAWWWAAALGGLLIVFGGGIATRVPLYLSSDDAHRALLELVPPTPGARVVDLGCGFAGPLLALARARRDLRLDGYETSPFTWLVARLRCLGSGVRIHAQSIWQAPIADADVVYAFLSSEPMPVLHERCREQMRPGALLVSNTFAVPGVEPLRTIPLTGRSDARLFVYRM